MPVLDNLTDSAQLRGLDSAQLETLAGELREKMIRTVQRTGGHLASSLGAVEITLALHRVMSSPRDRIVWDTGHQAYAHKLLTGRREQFHTLRQVGGVGGFPRRSESEHDVFDGGHAGTGVSIAVGLAAARDLRPAHDPLRQQRIAVCVGDAAIQSGLTLEALNHLGHTKHRLLIVLNDNEMSISPSVGGLSTRLNKLRLTRAYQGTKSLTASASCRASRSSAGRSSTRSPLRRRASSARGPRSASSRTWGSPTSASSTATTWPSSRRASSGLRAARPGDRPREDDQGQGLRARRDGQRQLPRGQPAADRPVPDRPDRGAAAARDASRATGPRPTRPRFAEELVRLAAEDERICAITAGCRPAPGLARFGARFPARLFDVGIAEQHAVTMAAGLALGGKRPVVALYSTFSQRAYDQIVHDVCQNDLPVLLAIDRAGLVGEDGTSHQGMFTLSAQRALPNLVIGSPKDEQELRDMVVTAFAHAGPISLHYPRDPGEDLPDRDGEPLEIGRGEVLRSGGDLLLVGFGPIVQRLMRAADVLERDHGLDVDRRSTRAGRSRSTRR